MKFKIWAAITVVKWSFVIIVAMTWREMLPPIWVSILAMACIVAQIGSEYLYPGGYRAVRLLVNRSPCRIIFVLGGLGFAGGTLLLFFLYFAVRYHWLSRPNLNVLALSSLIMVGLSILINALSLDTLISLRWKNKTDDDRTSESGERGHCAKINTDRGGA